MIRDTHERCSVGVAYFHVTCPRSAQTYSIVERAHVDATIKPTNAAPKLLTCISRDMAEHRTRTCCVRRKAGTFGDQKNLELDGQNGEPLVRAAKASNFDMLYKSRAYYGSIQISRYKLHRAGPYDCRVRDNSKGKVHDACGQYNHYHLMITFGPFRFSLTDRKKNFNFTRFITMGHSKKNLYRRTSNFHPQKERHTSHAVGIFSAWSHSGHSDFLTDGYSTPPYLLPSEDAETLPLQATKQLKGSLNGHGPRKSNSIRTEQRQICKWSTSNDGAADSAAVNHSDDEIYIYVIM